MKGLRLLGNSFNIYHAQSLITLVVIVYVYYDTKLRFFRRQLKNRAPPPPPVIKQEDIVLRKSTATRKENINTINGAIGKILLLRWLLAWWSCLLCWKSWARGKVVLECVWPLSVRCCWPLFVSHYWLWNYALPSSSNSVYSNRQLAVFYHLPTLLIGWSGLLRKTVSFHFPQLLYDQWNFNHSFPLNQLIY